MDDDEVYDRLTEIDMSGSTRKAEEFEALAQSLPVGEYGRLSFLIAAGEHRQMRKEYDEARRCFELAREDGGESAADPLGESAQSGPRHRRRGDCPVAVRRAPPAGPR